MAGAFGRLEFFLVCLAGRLDQRDVSRGATRSSVRLDTCTLRALPALSTEIAGLIADLAQARARLTFEASAPIHGNLFGDQILVDSQQIGIVDWDDLTLGDPMYDVGRLIAHLIFLAHQQESGPTTLEGRLEALLDAYARTSGKRILRARLNWHIAVALLLRAKISALRPLSAHWIDEIEMSIRLARRAFAIDGSLDTMVESTSPGMRGRSSTLSSG